MRPRLSGTYERTKTGWRCKIGRKWGRVCPTKGEALKSAVDARSKVVSKGGSEPLLLAAQELYQTVGGLSPRTLQGYRTLVRTHVYGKPIGRLPIASVTPKDIQEWLDALPVSDTSKARYFESMRAMFSRWQAWGAVSKNPCDGIKKPRRRPVRKRILTRDEASELLALIPERYRILVRLCLHGLRRGEACAVKREDFDGEGIIVRRTIIEVQGLRVKDWTKTGKDRWVPLDGTTASLVKDLPRGWLAPTDSGNPISPRNLGRAFKSCLSGTTFEGVRLHDLRSSFATWLIQSGVDIRTAAEILGHSPRMLAEVYARSSNRAKVDAIARLESVR